MRKIKETFFRLTGSNILRCVVIRSAKVYVHLLQVFTSLGLPFIQTPHVRGKSVQERVKRYNAKYAGVPATYHKMYNPEEPFSIDNNIHKRLQAYAHETRYEQFVCAIPNGKIIGTDTSVTPDNKILRACNAYPDQSIYGNSNIYKIRIPTSELVTGNVALITGNDTDRNYNHRMTFGLPKLHLFLKSGLPIDYFATHLTQSYHRESLLAAGVEQAQILPLQKDCTIVCSTLYTASTTTICGNMPQWALSYLRSLFLPVQSPTSIKKRRLYIPRLTTRKISNEDEITPLLNHYGFERIVLDNMSVTDQASLFQAAEIVVAPHGAGLTNIMFCSPKTKIVEIFHPYNVWGHYYCLSKSCGLDYTYMIGKSVKNPHVLPMDRDIWVDANELKKQINRKLG